MNLLDLKNLAVKKMKAAELKGWNFYLNTSTVDYAGECGLKSRYIGINSQWARYAPRIKCEEVLDIEIERAIKCYPCKKKATCQSEWHCKKLKLHKGGIENYG